ncbi:MAG: CBS domain-containing protein [Chloroflexota bacterium]|nr:CBS domain-containing protein [Chloroflexota bacterium]
MSPRAAARLDSLGFTQVYDYMAGKMDWLANGLPSAGEKAEQPRAGTVARRAVPTCRLAERIGAVQQRVRAAGWDLCIVTDDERVVLGRLWKGAWEADPETSAEEVMEAGPTTIRPNTSLESITERMQKKKVESILVTTAEGRLIGVLYRADAEQQLANVA